MERHSRKELGFVLFRCIGPLFLVMDPEPAIDSKELPILILERQNTDESPNTPQIIPRLGVVPERPKRGRETLSRRRDSLSLFRAFCVCVLEKGNAPLLIE